MMGSMMPQRRVLVVDDNADAAWLVAEMLGVHGHTARVAKGGADALSAVKVFSPEVVFLDLSMPDVDGFQVAVELRRTPGLETVRIVALSAWGDDAFRARSAAAGFDAHLAKPAPIAELLGEACRSRSRRPDTAARSRNPSAGA